MRARFCLVWVLVLASYFAAAADRRICVEWRAGRPEGEVSMTGGSITRLHVVRGKGTLLGSNRFVVNADSPFRLEIQVDGSDATYGPSASVVTVQTTHNPFSFFLRDVRTEHPIYLPEFGVAVTNADDARTYQQIEDAVHANFRGEYRDRSALCIFQESRPEHRVRLSSGRSQRIRRIQSRPRFRGFSVEWTATVPRGSRD